MTAVDNNDAFLEKNTYGVIVFLITMMRKGDFIHERQI